MADATEEIEEKEVETAEVENAEAETVEKPAKEKKQKKVVRRRKTKKERENPLTMAVRLAVESGKVDFGGRAGISSTDPKLFIVANNAPGDIKAKIESRSKTSNVPLIQFEGSSMELGSVCGKPFPVSVLSVFEEGSSNILELAKKK